MPAPLPAGVFHAPQGSAPSVSADTGDVMHKLLTPAFAACLLAVLLQGCGLSERPYPLVRTYTLELPEGDGAAAPSVSKKPRAVLIVTASPPPAAYDGKKLVYKLRPHELSPDFYNEFYTPPGRALADSLAKYLDLNSPTLQIVRFQGASPPGYSLEVGVSDFYGDYSVTPPVLRLAITVTLNDLRGSVPRVLSTSRYQRTPELTARRGENRPEALVRQMTETLTELFPEILRDVEAAAGSGR